MYISLEFYLESLRFNDTIITFVRTPGGIVLPALEKLLAGPQTKVEEHMSWTA